VRLKALFQNFECKCARNGYKNGKSCYHLRVRATKLLKSLFPIPGAFCEDPLSLTFNFKGLYFLNDKRCPQFVSIYMFRPLKICGFPSNKINDGQDGMPESSHELLLNSAHARIALHPKVVLAREGQHGRHLLGPAPGIITARQWRFCFRRRRHSVPSN